MFVVKYAMDDMYSIIDNAILVSLFAYISISMVTNLMYVISRYNIKLWKTFTDCFNCLPIAALVEGRFTCIYS